MPRKASDYSLFDPIYTFVDKEGNNINVDSEGLREWCAANKASLEVLATPVDRRIARSFLEGNVVDLHHVKEVMRLQALDPIIYGAMGTFTNGNPDVILIDGHHRYFAAAVAGMPFIPSYILQPAQWREWEIIGLPKISEEELRSCPNKAELKRRGIIP